MFHLYVKEFGQCKIHLFFQASHTKNKNKKNKQQKTIKNYQNRYFFSWPKRKKISVDRWRFVFFIWLWTLENSDKWLLVAERWHLRLLHFQQSQIYGRYECCTGSRSVRRSGTDCEETSPWGSVRFVCENCMGPQIMLLKTYLCFFITLVCSQKLCLLWFGIRLSRNFVFVSPFLLQGHPWQCVLTPMCQTGTHISLNDHNVCLLIQLALVFTSLCQSVLSLCVWGDVVLQYSSCTIPAAQWKGDNDEWQCQWRI